LIMIRRISLYMCALFFVFYFTSSAIAADGFTAKRKLKSKYFTIYIEKDVDIDYLALQIAAPTSLKTAVSEPYMYKIENDFGGELDALFLIVSDILDIRLKKNFKCTVKVLRDAKGLAHVADTLFGQPIQTGGFYVTANNTIYVEAENISIHILGHELAHAIQVQYFVVPPPVKIQEVLSGYVEYQLRKYS
jgi:hypothetical protein